MAEKNPIDVARRCLCLELLLQRLGLETDDEDPASERDPIRAKWLGRIADLGLEEILLPSERSFLERPVGTLSEEDLDDLHGRASGAVFFLWALGRLETRPAFAAVDDMATVVAEHGLLGTGSIAQANEAVTSSTLRSADVLSDALSSYVRTRGKAREPSEPEKIVAGVGAHHLEWILDDAMPFEDEG
jgi:hypothetical protein